MREIEALAFDQQQIRLFGGSLGVRAPRGLLASALARPKNLFVCADVPLTMGELAAAYAVDVSGNRPFVDGNKRTARQVSLGFLECRGVT
jgi:death on curing protein